MALTSSLLPLSPLPHYATSSADTSDSGGETSVSGRSSAPGGLRAVTLRRPPAPPGRPPAALGFSLRGGREHGTGFFVSAVDKGSEAYVQGLMVGDQIIGINGLPIADATHREVLQLIQSQSSMTFKVRSVGMIPVKDYSDSLTWRLVEPEPGGASEPPDLRTTAPHPTAHLFINVAPKAKLGCGICKGPEWRPGIFVQFTKENSLARGAGLRPGDQIIQCNNVVFTPDTPFTEAVSILRSTGVLELVIHKGAGLDLFPGESSGYNSSASSVAGDQSPETWPHKRLSVVREESVIDSDSRLTSSELSRVGERQKDSGVYSPTQLRPQTTDGALTVICVGPEDGPYPANDRNSSSKLAEICMVSQQLETKTTTVLVEVHKNGEEGSANNQSDASMCQLTNSSSVSSFSSSGSNSLTSAISQELQRRSEKRAKEIESGVQPPKVELHKCGMNKEKVEQHQQLMEEFKRAHKKMFAHTVNEENKTETQPNSALVRSKEERESFRLKRLQKEELHVNNMKQEMAIVAVKERDLRLERDKQDMTEADRELTRLVRRQQGSIPPPPPLPVEGAPVSQSSSQDSFPPIDSNLPPLALIPPNCPTPDYDRDSVASGSSRKTSKVPVNTIKNGNADFVEMQSLESFKLTNPSVSKPKPPSIYFKPHLNGSTTASNTSTETVRPTITIREYPKTMERKNPERFQFLNGGGQQPTQGGSNEPIASRLQDELSQTLSKANLHCDPPTPTNEKATPCRPIAKTTTVTISVNAQPKVQMEQNVNTQHNKQAPFYLHKNDSQPNIGNSANGSKEPQRKISKTVVNQTCSNGNASKNEEMGKNCVSFNLKQPKNKTETRTVTVVQPNGILKNGLGGNIAQVQIQAQANKAASKSIKFAGVNTTPAQEPKK